MKTLAIILTHNAKDYTGTLYRSLHPYCNDDYDLHVLDNGSTKEEEISEYTTIKNPENGLYGGGINLGFQIYMLNRDKYDSLLFMNNDLILHGYNFVKKLRETMFVDGYHLVSPSVIQPEERQCYWKQMHNWGSPVPRETLWVDFMCPLIHGDLVEAVDQFSYTLRYGFGTDMYTGYVCQKNGWKAAVVDTVSVVHMSATTFRDGRAPISNSEYKKNALTNMERFFLEEGIINDYRILRYHGETYQHFK